MSPKALRVLGDFNGALLHYNKAYKIIEELGIKNVSDEAVTEILKEVKVRGTEKRALLSMDEFREIVSRRLK
jgi:hypothetical protein